MENKKVLPEEQHTRICYVNLRQLAGIVFMTLAPVVLRPQISLSLPLSDFNSTLILLFRQKKRNRIF